MSDKIALTITPQSLQGFVSSLNVARMRVEGAGRTGMDVVARHFYGRTQAAVPRVTGALASSGSVTSHDLGAVLARTIGYGSSRPNPRTGIPTAEYAVKVHEIFNPKHPNSYKWLEYALRNYGKDAFIQELASTIRAAL